MINPAPFFRRMPVALAIAIMFGAAAGALVAATPQWLFENAVVATGLPSAFASAAPPLALKARLIAVAAAFALAALIAWALALLVERLLATRTARLTSDEERTPQVEVAETSDELPRLGGRRRPISADRELGAPLMSDAALEAAALPLIDQPDEIVAPAASFSPADLPSQPETDLALDPVIDLPDVTAGPVDDELLLEAPQTETEPALEPEPELPDDQVLAEHSVAREPDIADVPSPVAPLEIPCDVLPAALTAPAARTPVDGESSIDALIRRLEAGLARRGLPVPPDPSRPTGAGPGDTAPSGPPHGWMVRDDESSGEAGGPATPISGTMKSATGR